MKVGNLLAAPGLSIRESKVEWSRENLKNVIFQSLYPLPCSRRGGVWDASVGVYAVPISEAVGVALTSPNWRVILQ